MRTRGATIAAALVALAVLGGCPDDGAVEDVPVQQTPGEPSSGAPAARDSGPAIEEAEPARHAPDFTLPTPDGGEVSLSDYEGKILVLDFWATFCAGCVADLPKYQELYQQWDHEKVEYLAVSEDVEMGVVRAFLEAHAELDIPMAWDDAQMIEDYVPNRALPAYRVIDGSGVIRYEFSGPSVEKVRKAVERLLAEGGESGG